MQGDDTWIRQNDRVHVRGMRNTNRDGDIDWTDAAWNYRRWAMHYGYMGQQVERSDPRRAREYFALERQYHRYADLAQQAAATFNSFQDQAEQDRERLSDMDAPRRD
jgi:hypothetical protein